jgi:ribosomal protein L7/L12
MANFFTYGTCYSHYFWELEAEENALVLTIPNGNTIAYLGNVIELIEGMQHQGLPLFGSLLLAIAAINEGGKDNINRIQTIAEALEVKTAYANANLFGVKSAIDFLLKLEQLPAMYKTGDKRRLLLQTIFEKCHNKISSNTAIIIIRDYKGSSNLVLSNYPTKSFLPNVLKREFKVIALLNVRFPSMQSIIDAMNNVPDVQEAVNEIFYPEIEEQATLAKAPIDFVEALIANNKTFPIGTLVKRLWSGLQIPFHQNLPSAQPLGGVSDISNKGDFHRLLHSEFANEDIVFVSRVANNEALYLEREVPPQKDTITRILLIDNSIKTWGTPKTLAFAISIAIGNHPKTEMDCVYFIIGKDCTQVSLGEIEQVIDSLKIVSPSMDASVGLEDFFATNPMAKKAEIFFITSEDALQTTRLAATLNNYKAYLSFLITTHADGGINLYRYQHKSKKHLQKMLLPLQELWARKDMVRPTKKGTELEQLFPILFPKAKQYHNVAILLADEKKAITQQFFVREASIVYQSVSPNFIKGFIKIDLPPDIEAGIFEVGINLYKEVVLFFYIASSNSIKSYNLTTKLTFTNTLAAKYDLVVMKKILYLIKEWFYETIETYLPKLSIEEVLERYTSGQTKLDYEEYQKTIIHLLRLYKNNKRNYSVLHHLAYVTEANHEEFAINDFVLAYNQFSKKRLIRYNLTAKVMATVNLYLKDSGTKKIETIRRLRTISDLSLSDAKMLVDDKDSLILKNVTREEAERAKQILEQDGTICYIKNNDIVFQEGSTITVTDGILTFTSSNEAIPKFYIPFIINMETAFATDYEFAGNTYFLPNNSSLIEIDIKDFYKKYINPFMETALQK